VCGRDGSVSRCVEEMGVSVGVEEMGVLVGEWKRWECQ
jgi:hypothetical protein